MAVTVGWWHRSAAGSTVPSRVCESASSSALPGAGATRAPAPVAPAGQPVRHFWLAVPAQSQSWSLAPSLPFASLMSTHLLA